MNREFEYYMKKSIKDGLERSKEISIRKKELKEELRSLEVEQAGLDGTIEHYKHLMEKKV